MNKYSKLSVNSLEFVNNGATITKFSIRDDGYVDLSGLLVGDISINNSVRLENFNNLKDRFNLNQSKISSLVQEVQDVSGWIINNF